MLGNIVGSIVLLGAIFVGGYYYAAGKLPSFLTGGEKAPQTVAQRPAAQWTNGNAGQTAAMPATNAPAGFRGQPQQQQREGGINININSSAAIENSKKSPEEIQSEEVKKQEELKKKQEEEKKKKEEELKKKQEEEKKKKEEEEDKKKMVKNNTLNPEYDPNSLNPRLSWTVAQKMKYSVRYLRETIAFWKKEKERMDAMFYSLRVREKEVKAKLEKARGEEADWRSLCEEAAEVWARKKDGKWRTIYFNTKKYEDEDDFKYDCFMWQKKHEDAEAELKDAENKYLNAKRLKRAIALKMDQAEKSQEQAEDALSILHMVKLSKDVQAKIEEFDKGLREKEVALETAMQQLSKDVMPVRRQERDAKNSKNSKKGNSFMEKYSPKNK